MTGPVRIRTRVTMDDGTEYMTAVDQRDFIQWDRTRAVEGWPKTQDAQFLFQAFVAWSALRRTGQINGLTHADFFDHVANIDDVSEVPVNPTDGAPGNDFASK